MKIPVAIVVILLLMTSSVQANLLEELARQVAPDRTGSSALDNSTIVKGLKEALATGVERAITTVAKPDGYFGNQAIKILLPDKLQQVAEILGTVGYQKVVDELVVSMNRAAEQAAPKAGKFFGDAIRRMTVEDARGILTGGDTAATAYFEQKTRGPLFDTFKPTVTQNMDKVGTVRAYNALVGSYQDLPLAGFIGVPSLDLSDYVTNRALDGLFHMIGAEEKKIRTNPAAQTTDLLKKVFGNR